MTSSNRHTVWISPQLYVNRITYVPLADPQTVIRLSRRVISDTPPVAVYSVVVGDVTYRLDAGISVKIGENETHFFPDADFTDSEPESPFANTTSKSTFSP